MRHGPHAVIAVALVLGLAMTQPRSAEPQAAAAPATTVLSQSSAKGILGRQVTSKTGEDMGRIVDLIVDKAGELRAAVIDFGGFLGVGNRKIAVDRSALRFDTDSVILDLTRQQVKDAPEYKEGKAATVLSSSGTAVPMAPDDFRFKAE